MVIPATVRTRTSREGYLGCSFRARAGLTGGRSLFQASYLTTPSTFKNCKIIRLKIKSQIKEAYLVTKEDCGNRDENDRGDVGGDHLGDLRAFSADRRLHFKIGVLFNSLA